MTVSIEDWAAVLPDISSSMVNGRVVAMGALRHVTDSTAELERMRIHPRFKRRGFGRLILASVETAPASSAPPS